jgi:hypothetical protein
VNDDRFRCAECIPCVFGLRPPLDEKNPEHLDSLGKWPSPYLWGYWEREES